MDDVIDGEFGLLDGMDGYICSGCGTAVQYPGLCVKCLDNEYDMLHCTACSGTGEGKHDGVSCAACGGRGYNADVHDFNEPDMDWSL